MVTSTERTKLWRLAHPDRWKELQKRYRDKHKKPKKLPKDPKLSARRRRAKAQKEFSKFKLGKRCQKCGYNKCAAALDFHHLDPSIKERRVTALMWKSGLGKLEEEKCILVCKNCHYEIHEDQKIKENGDVY